MELSCHIGGRQPACSSKQTSRGVTSTTWLRPGALLNDVYREAGQMGIGIDGVQVRAHGRFNSSTWSSTGVVYEIDVSSDARSEDIERLLSVVDDVAEIPKALRSGTPVTRLGR